MSLDLGSNPGGAILYNSDSDDKSLLNGNNFNNYGHNLAITFLHKEEFYRHIALQNYSNKHLIKLKSYYERFFYKKKFKTPLELKEYISKQPKAQSNIVKTARNYLNFCGLFQKLPITVINKYRAYLKAERYSVDVYVPGNMSVLDSYEKLSSDKDLELIFLILATSGIKLVECLNFLSVYEEKD